MNFISFFYTSTKPLMVTATLVLSSRSFQITETLVFIYTYDMIFPSTLVFRFIESHGDCLISLRLVVLAVLQMMCLILGTH